MNTWANFIILKKLINNKSGHKIVFIYSGHDWAILFGGENWDDVLM